MLNFLRKRSISLSTVVLVLGIAVVLQSSISYTTTFGRLNRFTSEVSLVSALWLALRAILFILVLVLWILNRKIPLFRLIIVCNGVLTLGLIVNMVTLVDVLFGATAQNVDVLITDVLLMAIGNIALFSIWYWIIDPPGVEPGHQHDQAWDFLFPQRGSNLPHYESWTPRYTDYLFLAFTTSFAFSPTDTLPLTRRAKLLVMLQAAISIVTLTAIAGSAINILAGRI